MTSNLFNFLPSTPLESIDINNINNPLLIWLYNVEKKRREYFLDHQNYDALIPKPVGDCIFDYSGKLLNNDRYTKIIIDYAKSAKCSDDYLEKILNSCKFACDRVKLTDYQKMSKTKTPISTPVKDVVTSATKSIFKNVGETIESQSINNLENESTIKLSENSMNDELLQRKKNMRKRENNTTTMQQYIEEDFIDQPNLMNNDNESQKNELEITMISQHNQNVKSNKRSTTSSSVYENPTKKKRDGVMETVSMDKKELFDKILVNISKIIEKPERKNLDKLQYLFMINDYLDKFIDNEIAELLYKWCRYNIEDKNNCITAKDYTDEETYFFNVLSKYSNTINQTINNAKQILEEFKNYKNNNHVVAQILRSWVIEEN